MNPLEIILWGWLAVFVYMTLLYLIQHVRCDAGVVDVGWASSLGLLALYYAVVLDSSPVRRGLVCTLACLWAFRLAIYIFLNRIYGKPEEGRYQTLRKNWGSRAPLYFFLFFQVQGILAVLFSLPFLLVMAHSEEELRIWDLLGAVVILISIAGESLADYQLALFRSRPNSRGKTCREGLWHYSRHPNYFFEWIHWWGYCVMAIEVPWGWLNLLAPLVMLFFLFKVTGIPATEAQALVSRGGDYRDYQRTTSVFIPWFPKA